MPRTRYPQRWMYAILLTLIISLPLHLILYPTPHEQSLPWHKEWWQPRPFRGSGSWQEEHAPHTWTEKTWRMSPPEVRQMIVGTKGFYVRDWSVGLGWNNLRYIIEASCLHAKLLNRVLVLPSFVFARSCEFPEEVCSQYGLFVDREEAIGWNAWSGAPLSTLAWQIPLQVMLDLPHLRKSHPVILASEFFELHGLDPSLESLAGDWNRGDYEVNVTFPSIHVIPNGDYDPPGVVRVDTLKGFPPVYTEDAEVDKILKTTLGENLALQWDDAKRALLQVGDRKLDTDEDIEHVLWHGGWAVTHTYLGAGGMDYTKTVIDPVRQVVPRSRVRGFVEDYSHLGAEVLLLEGETHLGRKPGALRFTTQTAREDFTRLVLFGFRPVSPVRELAKVLAERMKERCGGRMWMAAHMRRGDFLAVGWSMEKSLEDHFARIRNRLDIGRETLRRITVPLSGMHDIESDNVMSQLTLPQEGDPIFLATDERDTNGLAYLRNHSAILIHDLLTIEDRRTFGWPLIFTDVLALIEKSIAVEASYFYGHALSSFAGGVLNMRVARGADPRTIHVD